MFQDINYEFKSHKLWDRSKKQSHIFIHLLVKLPDVICIQSYVTNKHTVKI